MRRFFKIFFWLLALILVAVFTVLTLLLTPPGEAFLARTASDALSSPGIRVNVAKPDLSWDGGIYFTSISASDAQGELFNAKNIRARWRPEQLLGGKLKIDSIEVETFDIFRQPASQEQAARTDSGTGSLFLPVDIALDSLQIKTIHVGPEIAGTSVLLTARASFQFDAGTGGMVAKAGIDRDGGTAGSVRADIDYRPGPQTLRVDLSAKEPAGGLIARLLDIGEFPAIDFSLKGNGPLQNWAANLALALDGIQTVTGKATLAESQLAGEPLRQLDFQLAGALEPLAPAAYRSLFAGSTQAKGSLTLHDDLTPKLLHLNVENAALVLSTDGERTPEILNANLTARLKQPVVVTASGEPVTVSELTLKAKAAGSPESASWDADLEGRGIASSHGTVKSLSVNASGEDANLSPATLKVPMALDLVAEVGSVTDPRFQALSGTTRVAAELIAGKGNWAEIRTLAIENPALEASLKGFYAPDQGQADGTVTLSNLADFSALAGRSLSGSASIGFKLEGAPQTASGTVTLDAKGRNVALGITRLDPLLAGGSTLTGQLSRDDKGALSAQDLHLVSDGIDMTLAGQGTPEKVAGTLSASFKKLALIDPALTGRAKLEAEVAGPVAAPQITANLSGHELTMQGEPVDNLTASAALTASLSEPIGNIHVSATFRKQPLTGHASFSTGTDGTRRVDDILLETGQTRLTGALAVDAENTPSGKLTFSSPDLAEIGPLLLQDIAGALNASVDLGSSNGLPVARIKASAKDIERQSLKIASAALEATVLNPLSEPRAGGTLTAAGIKSGGTTLESLTTKATGTALGTDFEANALLDGGKLDVSGHVGQTPAGTEITLSEAKGQYQGQETRLSAPARIVIPSEGPITLDQASLKLGSGQATIAGTVGDAIDLAIALNKVPAELADLAAPSLRLGGRISGKVDVTGSPSAPEANWSLDWANAEAAAAGGLGLPGVDIKSEGRFAEASVKHTTVLSFGGSGKLTAAGTAQITGVQNLAMTVTGSLPFAVVQRSLTQSGLRLDGAAAIDLKIGGTIADPAINGEISTRNATAVSLNTGLVVKSLAATAKVSRTEVSITSLTGTIGAGGTLSASGTIGLSGSLPASLSLKINDGTYTDGRIVTAKLNADMTLSGPLATAPKVSGNILIKRADITIPKALATTLSPVDVKHVNAPGDVARQAAALNAGPKDSSTRGVLLDVNVNAPGQIYVRGRGLQVELGGRIGISGTSADPATSGAFTLKNGTLTMLSRLLTLTKGEITFLGNFDPRLDFAATTTANSTTVTVGISGNATDPKVTFSSSPAYPQEEILALLLFGQNLSSLSATQVAQLAAAVATLGGADPLDNLRKNLGVDSINITTDENNNATAELRKRVGDKLSVGVQQGTQEGTSRVTVDIDVTKNLRARGEADAAGSSKAGIFFEKEY